MEGRRRLLKITIVSAENLPRISSPGKMNAYAEVSIEGRPSTVKKSDADMVRELNPRWNFATNFNLLEQDVQQSGVNLAVKILSMSSLGQDVFVGQVRISVKSLFDMGLHSKDLVRYDVNNTTTSNWKLYISYSFADLIAAFPHNPNPSHGPIRAHGYNSPSQGYGYYNHRPNLSPSPRPAPIYGRGQGPSAASPRPLSTVFNMVQLANAVTSLISNAENLSHHHHHDVADGQSSHHVYDQYNPQTTTDSVDNSNNHSFGNWPDASYDYDQDYSADADYDDSYDPDDSDSFSW